jgi:cytochrome c oxidase assembly factor CtaG
MMIGPAPITRIDIAGSYLLQAFVAAVPFARRERWAWWATLGSLALWFVVDSSLSLAHGAAFNVLLINLMPLVVFVPPLVATRRAFFERAGAAPGVAVDDPGSP